jgi:hypothetical protein
LTRLNVSVIGTPGAVFVEVPKLLRMSLRTMPLLDSTFDACPLTVFEPSAGYGPAVSSGSALQVPLAELLLELELLLEELLEDELLLLELLAAAVVPLLLPPPQAAANAAAPLDRR